MIATLTDREVEVVVRALKYWRSHRDPADVRERDRTLSPEEFELLLAKLGGGALPALSPSYGGIVDLLTADDLGPLARQGAGVRAAPRRR